MKLEVSECLAAQTPCLSLLLLLHLHSDPNVPTFINIPDRVVHQVNKNALQSLLASESFLQHKWVRFSDLKKELCPFARSLSSKCLENLLNQLDQIEALRGLLEHVVLRFILINKV